MMVLYNHDKSKMIIHVQCSIPTLLESTSTYHILLYGDVNDSPFVKLMYFHKTTTKTVGCC